MSEDVNFAAQQRREKRMERYDKMAPVFRELVQEYGMTMIDAFIDCGVHKPAHIKHLIRTVRQGSVEIGNRNNSPMLIQSEKF